MLKVQVDWDRCQHYGQCVFEAPEIFRLNDQDELEHEATADESHRAEVEAAIDICPMQAISLAE
ncbi:MAG: ferredoxin [Propionicimonas sp.]